MPHNPNLQQEMQRESDLIIASVDWIETQINNKLSFMEELITLGDTSNIARLESEILLLLNKLNKEEYHMTSFMEKYKKKIYDEKKKILPCIKQKK